MSSVITIVQSNAVHVLTDGSAYSPNGAIVTIGPKIFALPHLSAAMAIRGPASARPILGEAVSSVSTSFDELRSLIPDLLERISGSCAELFATCHHGTAFEVIIAGVSESDGPTAYIVPSHTRYGNAKPFDLIPLEGFVALPNSPKISAAMAPLMPVSGSADDLDPASVGLAVMEIQRANPDVGDEFLCPVGGFAQLTTVTVDAVTSRIIHRWPDVIGQCIGSVSDAA